MNLYTPERPLNWPPLVKRIRSHVANNDCYLVGGCVRDALVGRLINDIDITTFGDGIAVAKLIANGLKGAYFPLDETRRIGRALIDFDGQKHNVDVASVRGVSIQDDLSTRDFTINSMAVSLENLKSVVDPLDGANDLRNKILRACYEGSVEDDPVRALRALRIALDFRLFIEPTTRDGIRAAAVLLSNSDGDLYQPERIRDELFKILSLNRPKAALTLMNRLGLTLAVFDGDKLVMPAELESRSSIAQGLADLVTVIEPDRTDNTAAELLLGVAVMTLDSFRLDLQAHLRKHNADNRMHKALLLLGAATRDLIAAETLGSRFKLSRDEIEVLRHLDTSLIGEKGRSLPLDDRAIHKFFAQSGSTGIDLVLLWLAEFLAAPSSSTNTDEWGRRLEYVAQPMLEAYFRRYDKVIQPVPLVTGRTLQQEIGIKPGPSIGRILRRLAEEQASGYITTSEQAIRFAKRLLADNTQ